MGHKLLVEKAHGSLPSGVSALLMDGQDLAQAKGEEGGEVREGLANSLKMALRSHRLYFKVEWTVTSARFELVAVHDKGVFNGTAACGAMAWDVALMQLNPASM
ncbi:hypothetical protein MRB53_017349 [Persea americana]|uniref:Uncharacterized protein n=1 Tax=Persea americana TaxID=3435 RepID=A0ACC2M4T1_PERAE|nr:hypothetical protein MRB53_017349 [Persea americana]